MSHARIVSRLTSVLAVCVLCTRLYAAPIAPGGLILAPAEPDPTSGFIQAGTGFPVPFASPPGPGSFSGTLTTFVIAGDPSNPFGGLTFVYRITNDAVSLSSIERMTNLDFTGLLTDVSYQASTFDVPPTSVDRDASGSTVGWSFSPLGLGMIPAGGSGANVVIQTNATAFAPINANIIDGSMATASSFGPVVVPEPASLALLAIGMLSVGVLRRRQTR